MFRRNHHKPRSRAARIAWRTFGVLTLALTVCVVALALNWRKLGPFATAAISKSTGREFAVRGDVQIRLWSWRPRLVLHDVTFGNAEWGKQKNMLEVGRFEVTVRLRRLLHGDLVLPRLRVDNAIVGLEAKADGTNNWTLWAAEAAQPDDRTEVPAVRSLRFGNTRVTYFRHGAAQSGIDLQIHSATGKIAREVRVAAQGRYQKNPAKLSLVAGPLAALHDPSTPYPIDLSLEAGDTSATIRGALRGPLDEGGLDVQMNIQGASLSRLYPLIGVVLPISPPYRLSGRLEHEGDNWRYREFNGKMGDSDLSGTLNVDVGGQRPMMTADFHSKLLDFDDLAGLVGAPPSAAPGETASADQKAQSAAQARSGLVLPATPVDIPRLNAMDIDARLRAARVRSPEHLPIDRLDLKFLLKDGTLRASPASFDVAGGSVILNATLFADRKPARVEADVRARGLRVARIVGDTPFTDETRGTLGGEIKLAMRGMALRDMAATADGSARLALADARVSHLLVELAGLDVMQSLGVLIKGDESIPVRCAAFDFTATNGNVRSNLFVIDTDVTNITADVQLHLGTERLDMAIHPHPKDLSLLSLRQGLRIEGRLADLDFYPDPLKLGPVSGFMQKVNFLLAPIIGLLTPFDVKMDKGDNGCAAFLNEHASGKPDQIAAGGKPASKSQAVRSSQKSKPAPALKASPGRAAAPVRKAQVPSAGTKTGSGKSSKAAR